MKVNNKLKLKKNAFPQSARSPVKSRYFIGCLAITILLAACAGNPEKSNPVLDRAQLRWDSLFASDLDTAYSLYSPGYRSKTSRVDYEIELRMRRVKWTSATYKSHECSENRCLVTFDVGYSVKSPVPGLSEFSGSSEIQDTWIKTNGEWWYLPPKHKGLKG